MELLLPICLHLRLLFPLLFLLVLFLRLLLLLFLLLLHLLLLLFQLRISGESHMTLVHVAATAADEVMLQTVTVQRASEVAVAAVARKKKDAVVAKHLRKWVGGGWGLRGSGLPDFNLSNPCSSSHK